MSRSLFYRIAGIVIETVLDASWHMPVLGILENYVCDAAQSDVVIECAAVDELPWIESECVYYDDRKFIQAIDHGFVRYDGHGSDYSACYVCTVRNDNHIKAYVKSSVLVDGVPSHLMAELLQLEHLLALRHGILLHASVICVDDEAVLFTAPSQTGKSTQASLWESYAGAEIVNGDRCAVVVEEEGIFVYGIPFAGSSGIRKNVRLPLKAIVYLKQGLDNEAVLCRGVDAFCKVYEGISVQLWDEQDVQSVMDTVSHVVQRVPVLYFSCTPDEAAVLALKKKLEELEHEKSD